MKCALDEALFVIPEDKNLKMIKKELVKVELEITRNLTKAEPDMDEFHQFSTSLFGEDIPEADSVRGLFKILSARKCWDFFDLSNLESIVELFSGELEEVNMRIINSYKEKLAGYKTARKIVEYIKENSMEKTGEEYLSISEDKEKYNDQYRSKLSVKLVGSKNGINISLESLMYVEKLWNSICLEFRMPSLPKLLDSIVEGSILIHWLIHHILVWNILEKISDAGEFFDRECIASLCLEDVCIYDQETGGVVQQKVSLSYEPV